MLKKQERLFIKSIIVGSILIVIVYVVFTFLVMGVTGAGTTEVATIGLGERIGSHMIVIGNLLAFFTMGTSFLTIGLGMKDMFQFDFSVKKLRAWLYTMVIPIVVYFVGARDFIMVLGIVGGVLTGIQSVIIIGSFWKARKSGARKPEFSLGPMRVTGAILILFFVVGAVLTLLNIG